jgi:hypothetical protein
MADFLRFVWEYILNCASSSLSDLGTSGLGWIAGIAVPVIVAVTKARRAPSGSRWSSVTSQWRSEVRYVFWVYLAIFTLVFLWEAAWRPSRTFAEAGSTAAPSLPDRLSPSTHRPPAVAYLKSLASPTPNQQDDFTGAVEYKIISGIENRSTPFAVLLDTSAGCAVEPIQALMFIRLTNNTPHEKMITKYVVEQGYKQAQTWTWWRLRRLDLRSGAFITFSTNGKAFNPAVGVAVNFPSQNTSTSLMMVDPRNSSYQKVATLTGTLLDNQIGNVNLASGHSAVGWAAFQYTSYHGGLDTRISIVDEQGKQYQILSLSNTVQNDVSVSPHVLTITGVTDASTCTIRNIPYNFPQPQLGR